MLKLTRGKVHASARAHVTQHNSWHEPRKLTKSIRKSPGDSETNQHNTESRRLTVKTASHLHQFNYRLDTNSPAASPPTIMRRSSQRLVQTLDAAASRRPSYICKSCLHPSSTISASSSQVRTYASSTASEETWRKRLWGEKEVEKQDAVAEGLEQPAKAATTVPEEEVLDENYVPALSIEGLRRVGGKKEYPASHTRLEARFAG